MISARVHTPTIISCVCARVQQGAAAGGGAQGKQRRRSGAGAAVRTSGARHAAVHARVPRACAPCIRPPTPSSSLHERAHKHTHTHTSIHTTQNHARTHARIRMHKTTHTHAPAPPPAPPPARASAAASSSAPRLSCSCCRMSGGGGSGRSSRGWLVHSQPGPRGAPSRASAPSTYSSFTPGACKKGSNMVLTMVKVRESQLRGAPSTYSSFTPGACIRAARCQFSFKSGQFGVQWSRAVREESTTGRAQHAQGAMLVMQLVACMNRRAHEHTPCSARFPCTRNQPCTHNQPGSGRGSSGCHPAPRPRTDPDLDPPLAPPPALPQAPLLVPVQRCPPAAAGRACARAPSWRGCAAAPPPPTRAARAAARPASSAPLAPARAGGWRGGVRF